MNFLKIKDMFKFFKTEQEKKVELATLDFYNRFKGGMITPELEQVVDNYLKAGFKVKKEDGKILGEPPLDFLLWNAKVEKHSRNYLLEKIWNYGMDDGYKKYVIDNPVVLENTFISIGKVDSRHDMEKILDAYFGNIANLNFYTEHVLDSNKIKKMGDVHQGLDRFLEYVNQYSSLHPREKEGLTSLKKALDKKDMIYEVTELSDLFKAPTVEKSAEPNKDQKHLNTMIKTLNLYETKFSGYDSKEKLIFQEILSNLKTVNDTDYLQANPDKYAYVERLIYKHLPELLSDYLEIPEKVRTTYKDDKGRTPKAVFDETLSDIHTNVKILMNDTFNENFTNLKVKNRLVKNH